MLLTMTTAHSTVVIGNSDQIISGRIVFRIEHVCAHRQILNWELNQSIDFIAEITVI